MADEPLLFHAGHRRMFPLISDAEARITTLERLRWLSFGHIEVDECGAMNEWLAAAPHAQIAHAQVACDISLYGMADRAPRALADGESLDLGGRRVRFVYTPRVPHGWEAAVMFEETASTLLCGDLFTHSGDGPPITGADVLGPALNAEAMFHAMCGGTDTGPMLRKLAALAPNPALQVHVRRQRSRTLIRTRIARYRWTSPPTG